MTTTILRSTILIIFGLIASSFHLTEAFNPITTTVTSTSSRPAFCNNAAMMHHSARVIIKTFASQVIHKRPQVHRNMSADGNDEMSAKAKEAQELLEKARKLREEIGVEKEEVEEEEEEEKKEQKSGDLYDDEVEPYKVALSDNMRSRLMAEANTGLDSNAKQTNVILYISIAIVALVALGGKGILF